MGSTINTNIASLNAQRNLTTSQTALATSLQRLSSGLRINSAKDDAAGLAISERFSTQIRGLNQAVRNANDGVSLAQTGEGALAEMSNNLQRIRELAVQASNATNSVSDRAALNLEVTQRLAEIDRTAAQTSFNGQKILNGSFDSALFQVGANAGETIRFDVNANMRLDQVGKIASATSQTFGSSGTGGNVSFNTAAPGGDFHISSSDQIQGSKTVNPTTRLFGTAAVPQVDGSITINPTGSQFGTAGSTQVDTYSNIAYSAAYNYATAALPPTAKTETTAAALDLAAWDGTLGAGAHFVIRDDTGDTTIALEGNNYSGLGGSNTFKDDINTALLAAGSNTTASIDANGKLVLTSGETGSLATQPTIFSSGADAVTAKIVAGNSIAGGAGGSDGSAAHSGSFTVGGHSITLNTNITSADQLASAIDDQLKLVDAAYSAVNTAGNIKITLSNSVDKADVAIAGANAGSALSHVILAGGAANDAGHDGTVATAGTNVSFKVDTSQVLLKTNYAGDFNAMAADIYSQLNGDVRGGANDTETYDVVNTSGSMKITKLLSTDAVAITAATAGATVNLVEVTTATNLGAILAGFTGAGDVGSALTSGNAASFKADGQSILLDENYATYDALAADIYTQMNGDVAGGANDTGTYAVTNNGGAIKIERTDATAAGITQVNIAAFGSVANQASAVSAGFTGNGDTGHLAVTGTEAKFKVDGVEVTLDGVYGTQQQLVDALNTHASGKLQAGYSASTTGGNNLTITNDTLGSAAVAITEADANAVTAGITSPMAGTAGIAVGGIKLTAGDFTIASGSDTAVDLSGTYTSGQKLADAINSTVNNIYASINANGTLSLTSANALTLGGSKATAGGAGNFAFASAVVATSSGSLSGADTLTVAHANDLIQRVDSALGVVSTARSTFGAIQNRFESTIANLQGTSENLSAARSRIVDTDFASETASLTRNQILQQAGTAMLAQANALPQSVLSLLK